MQENEKFLLQYLEFKEYEIIGSYIHNSANFFLFPEFKGEKSRKTMPVFCDPMYMHTRIYFARELIDRFKKQLKSDFINEWESFLRDYKSPYE